MDGNILALVPCTCPCLSFYQQSMRSTQSWVPGLKKHGLFNLIHSTNDGNSVVMLSIYKTSFKEKNVSLIRGAILGDTWMSAITVLLVYRKCLRSEIICLV